METSKIKGHGEKLSRLRELALAALLNSSTLEEAAQKAGISVSTLRRWLQDPDFRKDYDVEKRHVLETATRELGGATTDAIRALRAIINHLFGEDRAQTAAATVILNFYGKEMQRYNTERRLSALEQKTADEKPQSTEPVIEESERCEDDVEEIGASMSGSLPEHPIRPTEAADERRWKEKRVRWSGNHTIGKDAQDLNHENTAEEGPGNGAPERDGDAHVPIRSRRRSSA
jgi:hypothetical protein